MTDPIRTVSELLTYLAQHGPTSARTLAGAPLQTALDAGVIRQMHTLYGPVVLLAPKGYAGCGHPLPVRLTGPDAVTDRAFQNDARLGMERAGYWVYAYHYKRHGQGSPVKGRRCSDAIVWTTLQVPDDQYAELWRVHGPHYRMEMDQQELGRPRLLATVANGGLRSQRFRRLVERYARFTMLWKHPLLLAVPDLERHAGDMVYLDRTHRRSVHELVRLVHLPLPDLGSDG